MKEKYGWQMNCQYGDYDNIDIVDYYKIYKDIVEPKKEATLKKTVIPKTKFNPLLLLVA